ncbi:NADP-dependent oxidoreductase domain-containing protein [Trichophaea hybrida]|nr:NADP-dependent oxidoreductase domain-containing protein [Trichophaea hybrida]
MSTSVPLRKLGRDGPLVSCIGFGSMGLSMAYGALPPDPERHQILSRCVSLSSTHIDTANSYGDSEALIGRWLASTPSLRSEIFLATKFGITHDPITGETHACNTKDYIQAYLVYVHRIDKTVPIEETVAALKEFIDAGKVRYIGLSEASANTIRRAHKVHPISAVQVEFSPFAREIEENGVLEVCRELGIAIVAYSPLGRGLLTGKYRSREDFEEKDMRRLMPRFSEENFPKNLKLVERIVELAAKKGCTPGQLTLAWILAQGEDFFVIPGTKRIAMLEENVGAAQVQLTAEEVAEIRKYSDECEPAGERSWKPHLAYADSAPLES